MMQHTRCDDWSCIHTHTHTHLDTSKIKFIFATNQTDSYTQTKDMSEDVWKMRAKGKELLGYIWWGKAFNIFYFSVRNKMKWRVGGQMIENDVKFSSSPGSNCYNYSIKTCIDRRMNEKKRFRAADKLISHSKCYTRHNRLNHVQCVTRHSGLNPSMRQSEKKVKRKCEWTKFFDTLLWWREKEREREREREREKGDSLWFYNHHGKCRR